MGRKAGDAAAARAAGGAQAFADAVRRQLSDKRRLVRTFDVGGSGVKTALVSALSLGNCLRSDGELPDHGAACEPAAAPEWLEVPSLLGTAPGEDGFASWLLRALPRLQRELDDSNVVFGVSTAGGLEHATGVLNDWWCGGGHPREWDDRQPGIHVAELMGLPRERTFILHDGSAHLLGCSGQVVPPPGLACFSLGTGVGFGLSSGSGAAVESSTDVGLRSHCLNGVHVSGAAYKGVWKQWLENPAGDSDRIRDILESEYAGTPTPWRIPWVSLVLGRRGMELAEATHGCPEPAELAEDEQVELIEKRLPAVHAYANQWLHFLHTQFLPQFSGATRRHRVERICFSGGVAEVNWPSMCEVLLDPVSEQLRPYAPAQSKPAASAPDGQPNSALNASGPPVQGHGQRPSAKRGRAGGNQCKTKESEAGAPSHYLQVWPTAPVGAGLLGAAIYALAGAGGAAHAIWTQ